MEGVKGGPSGRLYHRFNRCRTIHVFSFPWMDGVFWIEGLVFARWCWLFMWRDVFF